MLFNRTALIIIFISVFCANCKPFINSIDESPLFMVLDEDDLLKNGLDDSETGIILDNIIESKNDLLDPIDESSDEFSNNLNYNQLSKQFDFNSNQDNLSDNTEKRDIFDQSKIKTSLHHQRQHKEKAEKKSYR